MAEINDTIITYDSYRQPVTFVLLLIAVLSSIICTLRLL
jgi:hypothetical protein